MKSKCRICCRSGRLATLGWLIALAAASPAAAQYIYFDTNNDGINTWADSLNSSGPTTVNVWLDTEFNADGSPAFCGLAGLSSYEMILQASGGTMSWGTFSPVLGNNVVFTASNGTDFHTAVHSGELNKDKPLGRYRIGIISLQAASGTPCIGFGSGTSLHPRFATSFGSGCNGAKFDHTPRLGSDWAHSAVVMATPSAPPSITAPGIVVPQYLDPVVIDIQVASTACGIVSSLSANLSSLPAGNNAVFNPGPGNQSATLTWQPTAADHGDFPVTFTARGRNPAAARSQTTVIHLPGTPTSVGQSQGGPPAFALRQNRPNPFRPETSIRYSIPRDTRVSLVVFDAAGRVVAHLVDRVEPPGEHHVPWSGKDDRGRTLASGVYWYRLTTDFGVRSRRLVLAR